MQFNNSTVIFKIMLEDNSKFVGFYNSLLPHEKKFFKAQLMTACEVSSVMVYHWLKGDVRIKNPYRVIINNIAGDELFPVLKLACFNHAENNKGI